MIDTTTLKLTCDNCDNELNFNYLDDTKEEVIVSPCKFCLDEKYEDGLSVGQDSIDCDSDWQAGYDEGYADAEKEHES